MRRQLAGTEDGNAIRTSAPPAASQRRHMRLLLIAMATLVALVVAQIAVFGHTSVTLKAHSLAKSALRAVSLGKTRKRNAKPFAYMFYVTQDIYGCSALHLMDNLVHKVKMDTSRIDLVVLYSTGLSQQMRDRMKAVVPVKFIEIPIINAVVSDDDFWYESLTKLTAFKDWGYDRVVYMDADAVPFKNLDQLFALPPAQLYAPIAYWLPQPYVTSLLMVIEPSDSVFEEVIAWARAKGAAARYDMDIVNDYFGDTIQMLPAEYATLSSHVYGKPNSPSGLGGTVAELFTQRAYFIHYSCIFNGTYCKPWDNQTSRDFGWLKEQGDHIYLVELYEMFYRTQREKCQ